jgi:hypothetical protein
MSLNHLKQITTTWLESGSITKEVLRGNQHWFCIHDHCVRIKGFLRDQSRHKKKINDFLPICCIHRRTCGVLWSCSQNPISSLSKLACQIWYISFRIDKVEIIEPIYTNTNSPPASLVTWYNFQVTSSWTSGHDIHSWIVLTLADDLCHFDITFHVDNHHLLGLLGPQWYTRGFQTISSWQLRYFSIIFSSYLYQFYHVRYIIPGA